MEKLTKNKNLIELSFKGNKYQIVDRLVAFYLSKYLLSKEKYNSIEEADKLLWDHYIFYIHNSKKCESDAKKNIEYIISSYKAFF